MKQKNIGNNILGDFIIAGIQGPALSDYDKHILNTFRPIGILLLGRNFLHGIPYQDWIAAYSNLLSEIKKYTGREKMFITIDHEGGHVVRPPLPITKFPYPMLFKEDSDTVAKAIAIELKSLGVNISWSPDTDIFSNPANTVIGNRAFGTNIDDVLNYATIYWRTLEDNGVIGCAKHFPGHGDTIADSHFEMPVLNHTFEELSARELKPFVNMINNGVKIIMSSHILFPAIDKVDPGTLSKLITHDILRNKLGFKGIIVTDDLYMKAIMKRFKEKGIMQKAFNAGINLFIAARHPNEEDLLPIMSEDLTNSIKDGKLDIELLDQSRKLIYDLLNQIPMHEVSILPKAVFQDHFSLSLKVAGVK